MSSLTRFLILLVVLAVALGGCVRHTYTVELNDGQTFYADPPLVLDAPAGVYYMWIGGSRHVIPMESVRTLDDAVQICYKNGVTDSYTCYDALYQF